MQDVDGVSSGLKMPADGLCHKNRTMSTTCTTDGDGQERFSFIIVTRQDKVQQVVDSAQEFRNLREVIYVPLHRLVPTGFTPEFVHEVRVGKEADIKQVFCFWWQPVFEAKAGDHDGHPTCIRCSETLSNVFPELVYVHVGRIEDERCLLLKGREHFAFSSDPTADGALSVAEWVTSPGFTEPANQDFIG